jgi:formyl-CoA transferase
MPLALEHIRVLDLGFAVNTPYASTILADYGADVIKIEETAGHAQRATLSWAGANQKLNVDRSVMFEHTNTNKRSLPLDLKNPKGREILHRLVEHSDVLINSYRQKTVKKLGVDYETLSRVNPRLIYGVSSAYGQEGPDAGQAGFDYTGIARSGLMFTMGEPQMPPQISTGVICDTTGGTLLALGILLALQARRRTGLGQRVDTSLMMAGIHLERYSVYTAMLFGKQYERFDRARPPNPLWNYYRCADDRWIMLANPQPDRYWGPACEILGLPELAADPRYATFEGRDADREALVRAFDEAFAKRPRAEWEPLLKTADIAYAPVNRLEDLGQDPQIVANRYVVEYDHPDLGRQLVPGPPAQLSKTPATIRMPAPHLGQHTEEILTEVCGYSWDDVAEFRALGVVG